MSNSSSCNNCSDCPKRNSISQGAFGVEICQFDLNESIDTRPKQSANCLFNFVSKFKYLEEILRDMCITPRYCEENIEYLGIAGVNKIILPMRCFCDIPLNRLTEHVKIYGKYGIAFTREWGLKNKLQPVQYLNQNSEVTEHIVSNLRGRIDKNNYFSLKYIKPLVGKMKRKGKDKELALCFEDEKEWRYIPEMKPNDPPWYMITCPVSLNELSNKLYDNKEKFSLKFNFNDIKYLLVENEKYSKDLIDILTDDSLPLHVNDRYNLISKILIFDKLEEDWG